MKCEDCKIAKATIKFSNEPLMALTHGFGIINLCKSCYIIRIKNHIKDCQDKLEELENE